MRVKLLFLRQSCLRCTNNNTMYKQTSNESNLCNKKGTGHIHNRYSQPSYFQLAPIAAAANAAMSLASSMIFAVGFPAPCPALTSTRVRRGLRCRLSGEPAGAEGKHKQVALMSWLGQGVL
jgi:hypothetical protein